MGHRHAFAAARSQVGLPTIGRHKRPSVGNATVSEAEIVSVARMHASGQHQVEKSEICRRRSDNRFAVPTGGTPGGGWSPAVPACLPAARCSACTPRTMPLHLPPPLPQGTTQGWTVQLRGSLRLHPPAQVLSRGIPTIALGVGIERRCNRHSSWRGAFSSRRLSPPSLHALDLREAAMLLTLVASGCFLNEIAGFGLNPSAVHFSTIPVRWPAIAFPVIWSTPCRDDLGLG